MHYIPGTEIITTANNKRSPIRPGMTSEQIKQLKVKQTPEEFKSLQPGVKYTLVRIQPVKDNVNYIFANSEGERELITFSSVTLAEHAIAKCRGDDLSGRANNSSRRTD